MAITREISQNTNYQLHISTSNMFRILNIWKRFNSGWKTEFRTRNEFQKTKIVLKKRNSYKQGKESWIAM